MWDKLWRYTLHVHWLKVTVVCCCSEECETEEYQRITAEMDDIRRKLGSADLVTSRVQKVVSNLKAALKAANNTFKASDRYSDALTCEVKNKDFERAEVVRWVCYGHQ
jgi:hypothetical protein